MNGVSFDDLRWMNLLFVVACVAAIGVYGIWQRGRALRRFAAGSLIGFGGMVRPTALSGADRGAARAPGGVRAMIRLGLVVAALAALVAAIIGPRWGELQQQVFRRGIDVLVLLDVSRSMLARDIAPSRLERAKLAIQDDLLPALGGDRIGLITFAGIPTLKCPLTSDYGFVRLALEDISIASSPRGGTLIGDAIRKAQKAFHDSLDTYKLVILITDGEDQDSYPIEAAKKMWEQDKIPVVTIGLGDEKEGARIPIKTERGEEYVTFQGEDVRSRANFAQLKQIAEASGLNLNIPVGTRDFDLGDIYRKSIVPLIEYRQRSETETIQQPSQYHGFALAALLLVLLDSFLRDGASATTAAAAIRASAQTQKQTGEAA